MNIEKSFNLAKRHKDYDQQIMEELKKQDISLVKTISTKEARKVYNWDRQVAGTYQRSRAFSRLKISRHGIVYGKIDPEHLVEDMVARWFLSRFPMFIVMVESKRGCFVVSKDKDIERYDKSIEEILPELEKKLPINPILSDLEDFNSDEFWEGYYNSQLIKERKNKKYFLRNIPKKFHSWDGLKAERKEWGKDRKLDEF